MALDQIKNLAKVTVSTGYDADDTSIVLSGGHGARLPDPASGNFNLVWYNSTDYSDPADDPNVEIVRVTGKSTDTLTVTRGQESITASTKNTGGKTYKMILGLTAKMIADIITELAGKAASLGADDNYVTDAEKVKLSNLSGTNTGDNAANTSIVATKLDDFTAPDDNTDLNASTSKHGLLLKATAPAAGLVNVVGIANGETAYTNKALFDATVPSTQAYGDSAATGSAVVAARRDHKHAMPAAYVHPNHSGDVTSVADGAQTIANGAVSLAKMANLAQSTIIGRVTASTGVPEALTAANVRTIINVADGATANAKVSGANVDTGTDDTGFVTVKAINDSHNVPMVAPGTSGNIMISNGTDWTSAANSNLPLAGGTMTGDIQLGETDIKLDAVLSGDETWSGIVMAGVLGATIAVGDLCYLNADDSRWELVDANLSDGYDKLLGICILAGNDGSATEMLVYGKVRSAAFPSFTVGSVLYMSETAGDVTHTQPTTADVCIRVLGIAITAEDLFFNPSNDYIIHT